jgi:hypothetical protein
MVVDETIALTAFDGFADAVARKASTLQALP